MIINILLAGFIKLAYTKPGEESETAISFNSKVGKTKALVNSIVDMCGYGDNDGFKVFGYSFLGFYPSDSEITINSTDLNSNGSH